MYLLSYRGNVYAIVPFEPHLTCSDCDTSYSPSTFLQLMNEGRALLPHSINAGLQFSLGGIHHPSVVQPGCLHRTLWSSKSMSGTLP